MKKLLFITILLISIKSHSQCLIPFDEFVKSTKFSLSEFDTFALNKGFSYNGNYQGYLCDTAYDFDGHSMLARVIKPNSIIVSYDFISKTQYLDYKTTLETKGKLVNQKNTSTKLTMQYVYDNRVVLLETQTITLPTNESHSFYDIIMSNN